jgi:hypothetical protein
MTWAIIGLTAGFMVVLVLLYLLLMRSNLGLSYKIIALAVSTLFYWIQYQSLQQYSGWPSTDKLPTEFILIASEIREPNKQTGETGVMYWWVKEGGTGSQPPRVYQLPYMQDMHKKADQVIKEQKQGAQYLGKKTINASKGNGFGLSFEKISKASRFKKGESAPAGKK